MEEGKGESKGIIKDKKRKKIDLKGNKVRGTWESLGRGKGRRKDVTIISKKFKETQFFKVMAVISLSACKSRKYSCIHVTG